MAFQDFIVRHKGTLTNLLVYFLASVVPMVLNIVSMPLFSCYLSAEDFAVVGFYSSLSLLFAPLISFYLLHNYMRSYFQCDEKGREQLHVETTQLLVYFSAVLAVVSVALIWGYQNWFNRNSRIAVLPYAPYAMFYLSAAGLLNLKLTQLKMQKKSLPYFVYNSVNAVLTVGFSVFFVMLGGGSAGKLGGVFLGGFLLFGYFLWDAREYLFRKMQWGSVRRMLVFCFPLMLAAMLGFFSNGYDKVFLERHIALKELGYYSVGVSISHFLYVFSDAISSTFSPDIYESVAKKDFRRCSYFVLLKIVLTTLIVIPFVVFAPLIVNLLTAWKYQKAIPFCVITAFSSVTASLYYSLAQITIAMNHNKIPLLTRIVGSCLTIGMFYVLIQKWGTYGAAWGVVLNFLVYFLCNFLFLGITLLREKSRKKFSVPLPAVLDLKEKCTGCGACVASCPAKCLELKFDKDGFWRPALTRPDACKQCGLCAAACPVLSPLTDLPASEEGEFYSYQAKSETVLRESSSGGVFTLLAEKVLAENGIVFGCAFNYALGIPEYTDTDHVALSELRKSKYVESKTGQIFREVRKQLLQNRRVLFCGTPCHIQGLRKYLGNDFANPCLTTVDFVCHGVPSARNFRSYAGKELTAVDFRYKDFAVKNRGWKDYCLKMEYASGKICYTSVYASPFMIAYGKSLGLRETCYSCCRVLHSAADFTIGDFWGQAKLHPENQDNRGCSVVVIHSARGGDLWRECAPAEYGNVEKLPLPAVRYFLHDRHVPSSLQRRERLFRLAVRIFSFLPAITLFCPKTVIGRAFKKKLKSLYEK